MIHSVTLRVLVGTFLVTSCLAATPLFAANKDIDRLAIQIAALQGQIAEIQRANDEARSVLEKHALWLQGQRDVRVIVEGHCDERGTVEYNLALGEQRARAVRDYLASLGVAGARLRVVSYGKERPLDPGSDAAAMARNRRAHFNVR